MNVDSVHDLQAAFRELMAAFAFPGRIRSISDLSSKLGTDSPIPAAMLALVLVLLDAETIFTVVAEDRSATESFISRLTYAKPGPIEEADFVLVPQGGAEIATAIAEAREGTLIDPQLGATVIAFVERLDEGDAISLAGPGIEGRMLLRAGTSAVWVGARASKNREFPLGVDLALVDRAGCLAALPRSTRAAMED